MTFAVAERDPLAIAAARLTASHEAAAARETGPRTFASPEHQAFYEDRSPEVVASGWMGAGKSRVLVEKAWDLALAYPGAELGLFRKIHKSIASTTERTFWQEVAVPAFVQRRNSSEHWVDIGRPGAKPSRIWWLGLDADPATGAPSKVGSLNLDWAGVDEAVELTEADWTMLGGRLRRTTLPYRQLAAATNPADPMHWLRRRMLDGKVSWHTILANRFLPADYLERLTTMGDGVHAQRLAKGLWVAAEGAIWTLPDGQVAEAPAGTVFRKVVAGIDWGFVHAFAVEVVGETGSGQRHTIDEIYATGSLLDDMIPQLKELQTEWGISAFYCDPSEPQNIETLRRKGIRAEAATNDVGPGLDEVGRAIKAGATVSARCRGLLGEIPGYTWAQDRSTGLRAEKPVKVGDDACDAWRYAHMGLATGSGWGEFMRSETARMRGAKN